MLSHVASWFMRFGDGVDDTAAWNTMATMMMVLVDGGPAPLFDVLDNSRCNVAMFWIIADAMLADSDVWRARVVADSSVI